MYKRGERDKGRERQQMRGDRIEERGRETIGQSKSRKQGEREKGRE